MRVTRAGAIWLSGGAILVSSVTTTAVWQASGSQTPAASTSDTKTLGGGTITASPPGGTTNNGNSGQGNAGQGGGNGAGTGSPGKAILVSGSATGTLAPGHDDVLTVTVINPNSSDIDVSKVTGQITAVVESSGAQGPTPCAASWFHLLDYVGSTRVLAGKSNTLPMTLRFDDSATVNQDRCKGASYSFRLSATASQVG